MLKNIAKLLIGLSIFSPIIVDGHLFFPFITGKAIFFRVLVELAFLALALHILLSKDRKKEWKEFFQPLKNPIVLALTLFAAFFVISSFTALNPTQAFWSNFERGDGGFQIIHYYIFAVFLISLFRSKRDLEKLLLANLISALYISTYGILQWLALDPSFGVINTGARISGTLGNASYLAALMLFSIGYLLYFLIRTKNIAIRIFGSLLIPIFVLILLKTGTRAALIAFIIAGIVFLISNIFRKDCSSWLKKSSALLLILGFLFVAIFLSTKDSPAWTKVPLLNRQLNFEKSLDEIKPRLWSWQGALKGFTERPILGWGAENYPFVYDNYYHPGNFGRESFFDRVHNLYLEHLISGGILLFLSFLSVLFLLFKRIFKKKKDIWFSILLTIPIAYVIQAFFLFDVLVIYICFYILLAIALNEELDESKLELSINLSKLQIFGILLISIFLLLNTLFFHWPKFVMPALALLALIIFYEKNKSKEYFVSVLDASISVALIVLIVFTIYTTTTLPLKKNKALVQTFATNNIEQKYEYFKNALSIQSPIGQEEVVGALDNFMLTLTNQLTADQNISVTLLQELVAFTNTVHDQNQHLFAGLRHIYTNGGFNIRLGFLYGQQHLIDRGRGIYYDVIERYPTRIEFIVLLLEAAKVEGNKEEYERLRQMAIQLRPDLSAGWPPFENVQ